MFIGEFADILTNTARLYRNGELALDILPKLIGQAIDEKIVRQIIEPYIALILPQVSVDTRQMVINRFERYAPRALMHLHINTHMHHADASGLVSQENADAILTMFVNEACIPLDLAFYAKDLFPAKAAAA